MAIEVKYYGFLDSKGKQSKTLGWTQELVVHDLIIRDVDGTATVIKDEARTISRDTLPKYEGQEELSKEKFEALDVSEEEEDLTLRREKRLQVLARLQEEEKTGPEARKLDRVRAIQSYLDKAKTDKAVKVQALKAAKAELALKVKA